MMKFMLWQYPTTLLRLAYAFKTLLSLSCPSVDSYSLCPGNVLAMSCCS